MEASRLQPDILMIMIRDGDCANMFEAFSKVKWTPKTAYTLFCHSTSLNKFKTFNGV